MRYKTNPFVANMVIPIGSKSVQILGKDSNVLINQSTGEVTGTHVIARKKADSSKFVKVYADYMQFTFDLTSAGNKALRVLMWAIKERGIGKDRIDMDKMTLSEFIEETGLEMSVATFHRGVSDLEKAKIIAKTLKLGRYFINPGVMFNGDRIAFTTLIERE
jgi:hypothetical protein